MNRDAALETLSSAVPSERLTAARFLQFWAVPTDIPALREAIARESVGWVRRALESALHRLGDERAVSVDLNDLRRNDDEASADLAAMARARIARTVVHELEPVVGAIAYYSSAELGALYEESRTRLHVERLADLLRAIDTLGAISTSPKLERVDLRQLLTDVSSAEGLAFGRDVRVVGPARVDIETDPGLIRLIIGNGLKNSLEAANEVEDRRVSVTIIFGTTDRDLWVTVLDDAIGLPVGSADKLFEMGTSTKEDHLGMGLALSAEAARALGGNLQLSSTSSETRLDLTVPLIGRA